MGGLKKSVWRGFVGYTLGYTQLAKVGHEVATRVHNNGPPHERCDDTRMSSTDQLLLS